MASDPFLLLIGTGNPAPRRHRAGSSTLVWLGDRGLLIDLGPGAAQSLWDAGVDPCDVTDLFFTHHHFDHNADYGHFVLSRWDQGAGRGDTLNVYGPAPTQRITQLLFGDDGVYGPDLSARTQHPLSQRIFQLRGGSMPRVRPSLTVRELAEGDAADGDGWKVRTGPAVHAQPYLTSLAYRIDAPSVSVVISGDTRPIPQMIDLARGAHTLVHMSMDLEADIARWPEINATCAGPIGAGEIAAKAGVQRLVLVHLGERMDGPARQDAMVAEAKSVFRGEVVCGADRLTLRF